MTLIKNVIVAKLNPKGATKPKESNMCIIRPVGDLKNELIYLVKLNPD